MGDLQLLTMTLKDSFLNSFFFFFGHVRFFFLTLFFFMSKDYKMIQKLSDIMSNHFSVVHTVLTDVKDYEECQLCFQILISPKLDTIIA